MNQKKDAFRYALVRSTPIFAGYLFLGSAYGILMSDKGYPFWWPMLASMIMYSGSMQYISVSLLTSPFDPLGAFFLTLMVNARHLFYGVSMLEKFQDSGKLKPYMIFAMTDETFSITCFTEPPADIDRNWFMFFVTLLDQLYWIFGATLGGILGSIIPFPTKGMDFVMTALFVVIFLNQWEVAKSHIPAIAGVGASLICLLIFGPSNFILPAMACIVVILTLLRKPLSKTEEKEEVAS